MLIAVATVKDSAANVDRFVTRNLANGTDHLVVFTEDTGDEAEALLDEHPAVTHVPTGRGWWGEERPGDLNVRQRQNANLARVVLAPFAWAEWMVHVDGDEVALVDRSVLAALPSSTGVFQLPPLEAVSRSSWPGEVTHFKRLLSENELTLLRVLGLVEEPTNKAYFHGHVRGKRGVRIRTDLRIGLHTVKGPKGFVKGVADPGLRMLHFDSATAEEFARKWMTLAQSQSRAVYRKSRIPVMRALRTLAAMDLDDEVRVRYLRRIYEITTVEDFETLDELGLLEQIDAAAGPHTPQAPPAADLAALASLLAAAGRHPRETFDLDHPAGGYDVLAAVLAETGVPPGPAAEIIATVADRARASADGDARVSAQTEDAGEEPSGVRRLLGRARRS